MKRLIFLVLLGFLVSCNQEAKKTLPESYSLEKEIETTHGTEGDKLAAKLSGIASLSEEDLRNAFPKQLKTLSIDENVMVLGQQVMGSFGDKKISLSIVDATGINNQLASQFIDSYAFDKPQETENFKSINQERDGIKTHAEYYKNNGKSEIYFLYNKRFYVSLSNDDNQLKLNPDELWEAFDISALEPFKKF